MWWMLGQFGNNVSGLGNLPRCAYSNLGEISQLVVAGVSSVMARAINIGLVLAMLTVLPVGVRAQGDEFSQCLAGLQERAREQGRSESVVELVEHLAYQPRVIELDRRQPEFTTPFSEYLGRRVTTARIERGRELLEQYAQLLGDLEREYGVPEQYLVAFWGLETNYGGYLGKMPVLDSLATLACDPRRSDYFSGELLTALELLERERLDASAMEGSWAGAMGHTQFMPSAYHRYAVDGDDDGQVDLWNSVPDALTSAANFLNELGWRRGLRWGREVRVPEGFDYALAGLAARRPLGEWRELGLRDTDGRPLPQADVDAALLVPSGHEGPAFLVYDNFDVIMRWNRSQFYALAVGHLADRINGAGALRRPPPEDAVRLSREQIETLQRRLNLLGFDAGEADGVLGPGTRRAISAFQASRSLVADGHPSADLLAAVKARAGDHSP